MPYTKQSKTEKFERWIKRVAAQTERDFGFSAAEQSDHYAFAADETPEALAKELMWLTKENT
jgi:hypothetical protein